MPAHLRPSPHPPRKNLSITPHPSSGVRRIEAVAGPSAVEYLNTVDGIVRAAAGSLKV